MFTSYMFVFPAFDVDRGLEMIGPILLPFIVVYILVVVVVVVVVREKWERSINLRAHH